jgi:hypothetical protein
MNYIFKMDLRNQDTTPSYVVSWNGGTYPANVMPHLNQGDTVQFIWDTDSNTPVTSCNLYVRPLMSSETPSPFSPTKVQVVDLFATSTLSVAEQNGSWTFSILGMLQIPAQFGCPAMNTPFFIDPEAEIGTGQPGGG